jgi:hypothetical protein
MNESKRKYRESKKQLQEQIHDLELANRELRIRLNLIRTLCNSGSLIQLNPEANCPEEKA